MLEIDRKIIEGYQNSYLSQRLLAKSLGVDRNYLRKVLKKHGILCRLKSSIPLKKIQDILLLHKDIHVDLIARKLDLHPSEVRRFLRKRNLEIKYYEPIKNIDIFNEIDTEEKAYWLGFLYADGCVMDNHIFKLTLSDQDEDHLIKFCKFIGYEKEYSVEKRGSFRYVTVTFQINLAKGIADAR